MATARSNTKKKEKKLVGTNGKKFFYKSYNKDLNGRDKRENLGVITGLYDSNNEPLVTGNVVKYWYSKTEYQYCVIMFSRVLGKFVAMYGNWENRNRYDPRSYAKYNNITSDNGSRMKFTKVYNTIDEFIKNEHIEFI